MGRHEQIKPKKKKGRKRHRVLPVVVIAMLSLVIVLAVYISTPPKMAQPAPMPSLDADHLSTDPSDKPSHVTDKPVQRQRKPNFYTVLLVGTMDDYNTDTIMMASIDADQDIVNVVSIPRDTMVDISASNKKINGAYGRDGIDELCKEVQQVTGVYPDFYVVLNVKSFIKVVDLIGGVEFNVPYNMRHLDKDPQYSINLKKGMQTLNGKKALQMVRYRGTAESDFGRMQLQRDFLLAVAKKVLNSFSIDQVTDLVNVLVESIKTNMPVKDMLWFYLNVVKEIDLDQNVTFQSMPVESTGNYGKLSYVYLDKEKVIELMNEVMNPYDQPLTDRDFHIIHLEN